MKGKMRREAAPASWNIYHPFRMQIRGEKIMNSAAP